MTDPITPARLRELAKREDRLSAALAAPFGQDMAPEVAAWVSEMRALSNETAAALRAAADQLDKNEKAFAASAKRQSAGGGGGDRPQARGSVYRFLSRSASTGRPVYTPPARRARKATCSSGALFSLRGLGCLRCGGAQFTLSLGHMLDSSAITKAKADLVTIVFVG